MKKLLMAMLGIIPLLLDGCGYQNAYLVARKEMAELEASIGAPVTMHVAMWTNRTNELGLQMVFFNALSTRFQSSDLIQLTKKSDQADYTLDGEVVSINEGLTRGTVMLNVAYRLRDIKKGGMVWQVPGQTFSESYFIADSTAKTQDNKRRALTKIADDLAESIYMRTLQALRDSRRAVKADPEPAAANPAPPAAPATAAPLPAGTEAQSPR